MDYNTSREKLHLPEYGRNIQKMVNHIRSVNDKEERNNLAQALIQIMGNMNPHLRDVADFQHKLWDHLAIISNFDLDVDSPFAPPSKEDIYQKPESLPYKNAREVKFKHYGRVLQDMIRKAIELEAGEEKDYLIEVICNQMKKSYILWNRDTITDEIVFADFETLSAGQLQIPEGLKLREQRDLVQQKTTSTTRQQKQNPRQQLQKNRKRK